MLALCASLVLAAGAAQATPGALDPSFGSAGIALVPFGSGAGAHALVLQPDGRIVAAGAAAAGPDTDFALARLNSNGSLDPSFNNTGKVLTSVDSSLADADAVSLQSNGKIVAAGFSKGSTTSDDFAVVRYNANGSLDTGFGGQNTDAPGTVTTDINGSDDQASTLALQLDGKIVVAGLTSTGTQYEFAVVRYNANGSLDTGFGAGGGVDTPIGSHNDIPEALALQPDRKIVVAGYSSNGTDNDFAVVRYESNGNLDLGFGPKHNGKVTTSIGAGNDEGYAVAVQPDGKIVVAGSTVVGTETDLAVVRYNADGSLDNNFGTSGTKTISLGASDYHAFAVALQPDGKIVLAGGNLNGSAREFAFVRLNADGSLDSGFGSGGKLLLSIGAGGFAEGVALQPDGKLVAAGFSGTGSSGEFAFVRLLGNTLTVTKAGTGEGSVGSSPAGITCGSTCSAPFAAIPITLTATPQAGSVFSGWSGGGCVGTGACHIQLSSDVQVTATFTLVKTLTVTETGNGSGVVSSMPAGIDCGLICAHAFTAGTSVTLTARPARGSGFAGWSGACSVTTGRICTLQMDADHDVTAAFSLRCIVPKVTGKRLAAAKRAIKHANCSVGTVTRAFSASVRKGRVISQKPKAGTQHAGGSKVKLTVSKGR